METIEMIKNKFDESSRIEYELYNMCVNYIKERLSSLPNNEIYLNFEVTISYIGFYNINPYSEVKRIYLKDDDIYADTEDEDEYKITHASATELYEIAEAIWHKTGKLLC